MVNLIFSAITQEIKLGSNIFIFGETSPQACFEENNCRDCRPLAQWPGNSGGGKLKENLRGQQGVFIDSTDDDAAAKESFEDVAGNLDHVDDGEKLLHR